MRSYCKEHTREYDREAKAQGGAIVYRMGDYVRDPETGRVERRTRR
jgi:hypothetical protein